MVVGSTPAGRTISPLNDFSMSSDQVLRKNRGVFPVEHQVRANWQSIRFQKVWYLKVEGFISAIRLVAPLEHTRFLSI
jgi:hypothetical protein